LVLCRTAPSHPPGSKEQLTNDAFVRLAPERFASKRDVPASLTPPERSAPARFANERSRPLRSAPARSAPGQLVKLVGVGFETMVQLPMTVSADAGADAMAATRGTASETPIARTTPTTRRRRPSTIHPLILARRKVLRISTGCPDLLAA
jgi:hypothetical protein